MSTEGDAVIEPITASTAAKKDDNGNTISFSRWREANINDDEYQRDDDDDDHAEENDEPDHHQNHFFMFGQDDEEDAYEEIRYEYKLPSPNSGGGDNPIAATAATTEVVIRHHGAYPNATGLAVWKGAELLARFLCDPPALPDRDGASAGLLSIRGKSVLEVGAGAGLPGIVAHKVLGARRVLVTDGDYDALLNLTTNVERNKIADADNNVNVNSGGSILCRQLIWGKSLRAFVETHGRQDVILMADCVYMGPSLRPLWTTIDALLEPDGIVVYCQTAASAVPWKLFSEQVKLQGFEVCRKVVGKTDLSRYDIDDDDGDDQDGNRDGGEEYEQGVYVFRRRRLFGTLREL